MCEDRCSHPWDLFEELFTKHYTKVRNIGLSRLGRDMDAAEDIAQEVFIKLHTKLTNSGGRSIENWGGWLIRVTEHTIIDAVRKRRRRPVSRYSEQELEGEQDPAPGPEEEVVDRAGEELLRRAIRSLPSAEQEAIDYRIQGWSTAEIADGLRIKEATVRQRLHRATERLALLFPNLVEGRKFEARQKKRQGRKDKKHE